MTFKAKTACEAKVVNLELNFRKKQFKNGMKIDLLKCSWVVMQEHYFELLDVRIYMELQGLLSLIILPCLLLKHKLKEMSRRYYV